MSGEHLRTEVQLWLDEFNTKYPRPAMPPLAASEPFDLMDFARTYPNAGHPGVYLFFTANGVLLYIGKASCNRCIGSRLGDYFEYSENRQTGRAKYEKHRDVRYVVTVGIEAKGRAFEAPALEEYLIAKLNPPLNRTGKSTCSCQEANQEP